MFWIYLIYSGSSAYLLKLFGGLLCGWISDPIGRKKAMILANFPVLVSWYYFYYSTSTTDLFIANGLLGFSSGFLKIPCISYVGEISQPTIRGILVSSSTVSTTVGPLLIFLLATMTTWRNIALFACILQLLTLAVLFLVSTLILGCLPNLIQIIKFHLPRPKTLNFYQLQSDT